MKIKKITLFILLSLLTLGLITGCTQKEVQPPNVDPPEVGLPNPMEEKNSLEEIKTAIGFTFESIPQNLTGVKYYTLAGLAQVMGNLNNTEYTLRKATSEFDDISGMYNEFKNVETHPNANGIEVSYHYNANAEGFASWKEGNYQYTITANNNFNLQDVEGMTNSTH
ncbi:MAG: hypothetical protein ACRCU3_02640 [Eubacteriaceae bacterium]